MFLLDLLSGRRKEYRMTKVRIEYKKGDAVRFLSHLDVARAMTMALMRAKWPVKMSLGYSPRPRVSFYSPLPVGTSGEREYMDVELEDTFTDFKSTSRNFRGPGINPDSGGATLSLLTRELSRHVASGFYVRQVFFIDPQEPPLEPRIRASLYRISLKGVPKEELEKGFKAFLERPRVLFEIERSSGRKNVDLRWFVGEISLAEMGDGGQRGDSAEIIVHMTIKHENGHTIRPQWVLQSLLDLNPSLKDMFDPREAVIDRIQVLFD